MFRLFSDQMWQTDLSFVIPPPDSLWETNELREALNTLRSSLKSSRNRSQDIVYLMGLQPLSLGGLGQAPQTSDQWRVADQFKWRFYQTMKDPSTDPSVILANLEGNSESAKPKAASTNYYFPGISAEIINFSVAVLVLALRLPQMYSFTSVKFSLLTLAMIGLTGLAMILSYAATALLTQLSVCLVEDHPDRSRFSDPSSEILSTPQSSMRALQLIRLPIQLQAWSFFLLQSIAFILNFPMLLTLNEFGVQQFRDAVSNSKMTIFSALKTRYQPMKMDDLSSDKRPGCGKRRIPLTGLLLHLAKMSVSFPLLCEFMRMYWARSDKLCLVALITNVLVDLAWLFTWLALLLKPSWHFRLQLPSNVLSIDGQSVTGSVWRSPTSSVIQPMVMVSPELNSTLRRGRPMYNCYHGSAQDMNLDNYVYVQGLSKIPGTNYNYNNVPTSDTQYNTLPMARSYTEYNPEMQMNTFNRIVLPPTKVSSLIQDRGEKEARLATTMTTFKSNTPCLLARSQSNHSKLEARNQPHAPIALPEQAIYSQPRRNLDKAAEGHLSNGSDGSQSSHIPSQDSGVSISTSRIGTTGGNRVRSSPEEKLVVDGGSFYAGCVMMGAASGEDDDILDIPVIPKAANYSFLKSLYDAQPVMRSTTVVEASSDKRMCSQV
ncbi:hypothetical protein Ciccas_006816 [Cichlidogyrus casuarinus]|uniref:Uncharacterized protein n=1 Tax=Cichlidogyrus casuarinus TaxID=1844966 RepID=A0ABD2Q4Q7_9PLAT